MGAGANRVDALAGPRKIVHVDMDAFYASVEQRDRPELRGQPVVVAWTRRRGRRLRGVVRGAQVRRPLGDGRASPRSGSARRRSSCRPTSTRYREVSRQVRAIFLRHTDAGRAAVARRGLPRRHREQAGLADRHRDRARRSAREIREETGLTASAGVAPNKFLAKIASDWKKPDGLFVIRPAARSRRSSRRCRSARLPGVGKATGGVLAALGIATVGDLAALRRRASSSAASAASVVRLHELAHGIDEHPVVPDRPTRSISAEDTFERDLPLDGARSRARSRRRERVWAAAEPQASASGGRSRVKLKTADFRIAHPAARRRPRRPRAADELAAARAPRCAGRAELPRRRRATASPASGSRTSLDERGADAARAFEARPIRRTRT